ncbi:hypothetical protein N0M98_27335 [Paenibacillus doosanensis]|uniref:Uncharacterized protein n=1 Tax=Paenibacillus konkukensis TaxID=2020716 RepID=A0ABY4RGM2_9BACL|nr:MULTISPECIES: hypothetical protein [Paenibacillus]MCS7463824.1 hypothetical protein [Paenibacillus doosanensis]UQZ81377.1 hypothetical protein SK3146_00533 [Paenibacillus konkukensis]
MQTRQATIPVPSRWGINAYAGSRPVIWGTLVISSVDANGRLTGSINFRGTPIPVQGHWNERSRQIRFDSPYAHFTGTLSVFDDPSIRIRHLVLNGTLLMKSPSIQAGEHGTWIATTQLCLPQAYQGQPATAGMPPVGVFVTADFTSNPC